MKIGYSWQQSTVTDGECKGNVSCTSYSRTFGYGILTWTTWTTLRTMARTPQSTRTCTMRSSEHAAHRLLMHSVHTSHFWLKVSPCVSFHVIHACAPVCCSLSVSPHPSFYFLVLFFFQLYLMSNSALDEFSIEDPLCNSSLGSMVTLDYVTPLTSSALVANQQFNMAQVFTLDGEFPEWRDWARWRQVHESWAKFDWPDWRDLVGTQKLTLRFEHQEHLEMNSRARQRERERPTSSRELQDSRKLWAFWGITADVKGKSGDLKEEAGGNGGLHVETAEMRSEL